jgi:hypothetical protein
MPVKTASKTATVTAAPAPTAKARTWVKADGTKVACTEKQYAAWSARSNRDPDAQVWVVRSSEPTVPPAPSPVAQAKEAVAHARWLREQHWWTPEVGARALARARTLLNA